MKKLSTLLAVLLALVLALAAACAEEIAGPFTTEEELAAFLTAQKDEAAETIEFSCDEALYGVLSANNFEALTKMAAKCGIVDNSLRYSSSAFRFEFKDIEYGEVLWAECTDEAEASAAVEGFAAAQAETFRLFMAPELCSELYGNHHLESFAARAGIADIDYRYYKDSGIVLAENISYEGTPFVNVDSEEEITAAIDSFADAGTEEFRLCLTPELYAQMKEDGDRLNEHITLSRMKDYRKRSDSFSCTLEFTEVAFFDAQRFTTEEDLAAYLTAKKEETPETIEFGCDEALYGILSGNNFEALTKLAAKCGIVDGRLRYSDSSYRFEYSEIEYGEVAWAECADEDEARAAIEGFAAAQAETFRLFMAPELCDGLHSSHHLESFAARAGIADINYDYHTQTGIVLAEDISYEGTPFVNVDSEEELTAAIDSFAGTGTEEFRLCLTPELYAQLKEDEDHLDILVALSHMDDYVRRSDSYACALEFSGVVFSDTPRFFCQTKEEIVETIRQMGEQGAEAFDLVLPKELYEEVYEGYFDVLEELEAQAGLTDYSLSYSWSPAVLYYSEAVFETGAAEAQP